MKREHLDFLCCPDCHADLKLTGEENEQQSVETGQLTCTSCDKSYPVKGFIPRFVTSNYYADSFGPQWKTFANSQLDTPELQESALRFRSEIGWEQEDLKDKVIVEMGSGAGRFIDVVSKKSPKLAIGVDITDAVDASQETMGDRENVLFIQADIYHLPIKSGSFDFAYSIGVLHHTPDPEKAFRRMVDTVKDGGRVGVSLYHISQSYRPNRDSFKVWTKELLWAMNMWRCEFFRLFTTRMPRSLMLGYCKTVVPVLHHLNKIPVLRYLRYLLPSTCYPHLPVICSMVDTHDTYATKIVHRYRGRDVFQWFLHLGLSEIIQRNGRPSWVSITGFKPKAEKREAQKMFMEQPLKPGLVRSN